MVPSTRSFQIVALISMFDLTFFKNLYGIVLDQNDQFYV